jgi:RecA/RadA recombinase
MDSIRLLFRVIITDNTAVGLLLVVGIVAMATVAAMMARFHFKRYRGSETNYLNQTKSRLRGLLSSPVQEVGSVTSSPGSTDHGSTSKATAEPASITPPPPPKVDQPTPLSKLVSVDELASAVPPDSLIGDRLRVIALMRKSQTKVNMASLQQISRAREAARASLRFPAMAVSLAMLVGLLGTFIGIAIVIQQIGLNINQGDGSLESFGKVFGGMYTKFSTTLVGLCSAIVLSCLNFRLAQAQERLFEDLDRFTVSELLPATVPAMEDETLLERVSEQLEQSFTLIEDVARKNAKTAQEVGAIQAGFVDIVASIRQQMRTEASDRMQNLLGHVATLMQQMGRVSDSLTSLATTLPTAVSDSNQRLEKALATYTMPPSGNGKGMHVGWFIAFGTVVLVLLVAVLIKRG